MKDKIMTNKKYQGKRLLGNRTLDPAGTGERALRRLIKQARSLLEYHPNHRRTWVKK
jgi:hypothetical protein